MELTKQVIEKLEAEHGAILPVKAKSGAAAFRVPTPEEWQRFVDELADPEMKPRALKGLVFSCRVWPEDGEFAALIGRRPGLVQSFGGELTEFAGIERVEVVKK